MDGGSAQKPHVPMFVGELSCISSLQNWANLNIRVVGKLTGTRVDAMEGILESIGEEDGPFQVTVNFELVENIPVDDAVIRVFGEVYLESEKPVIKAKIVKHVEEMDMALYNQGVELHKKYVPLFLPPVSLSVKD